MSTMAQVNIRMDSRLKSSGDAVLNRMGITPTQLIRAVWMKVARGTEALDQLVEVLAQHPAAVGAPTTISQESCKNDPFEQRLLAFYDESDLDYSSFGTLSEHEWENLLAEDWTERDATRMIRHGE